MTPERSPASVGISSVSVGSRGWSSWRRPTPAPVPLLVPVPGGSNRCLREDKAGPGLATGRETRRGLRGCRRQPGREEAPRRRTAGKPADVHDGLATGGRGQRDEKAGRKMQQREPTALGVCGKGEPMFADDRPCTLYFYRVQQERNARRLLPIVSGVSGRVRGNLLRDDWRRRWWW